MATTIVSHEYYGEAYVLSGTLRQPVEQAIEKHASIVLSNKQEATHLTRSIKGVSIEGLVSFKRGRTRVSGARSVKRQSWVTLSSAVLEGLEIFDVFTADRLVSQVSTNHSLENGHFPEVTFLGTEFTNLKVSGFPLKLNVDLGFCGDKPKDRDISYLDNPDFLKRVLKQTEEIAEADGLAPEVQREYSNRLTRVKQLLDTCGKRKDGEVKPGVICSLVTKIGDLPIPGSKSRGHILSVPDFGTLAFGEVLVSEKLHPPSKTPSNYFELVNVKANLGCIGHGIMEGPAAGTNGNHQP